VRFLIYAMVVAASAWYGHSLDVGTLSAIAVSLTLLSLVENGASGQLVEINFQPSVQWFPDWFINFTRCVYVAIMLSPYLMTQVQCQQVDTLTGWLDDCIPIVAALRSGSIALGEPLRLILAVKLGVGFFLPAILICSAPSLIAAFRGRFSIHYKTARSARALAMTVPIVPLILIDILLGTAGAFFSPSYRFSPVLLQLVAIGFFWLLASGAIFPRQIAVIRHLLTRTDQPA